MSITNRLLMLGAGPVLAAAGMLAYNYEGEVFKTYVDPVGVLTACVGHTGHEVRLGQYFTQEQCAKTYIDDLKKAEFIVKKCTPRHINAGLISFAFNVGGKNFCSSTLAKKIQLGDIKGGCAELKKWVYAKGKKFRGLELRRDAEFNECIKGV